jgi:hypothetical protein
MGDTRAEGLRNKIALYRCSRAEGVDAGLAERYLREIKRPEAELARIDEDSDQRE